MIRRLHRNIEKYIGVRPTGWMGPGAVESKVTADLLKEAGYTHLFDWPIDDQPLWMRPGPNHFDCARIRWNLTTPERWCYAIIPVASSPT